MKVDNNADPRDFLFLMIEKKTKKTTQPPQAFSSSCPCVPLAAKKKTQRFWPTQH